jgi:hypothetical protein
MSTFSSGSGRGLACLVCNSGIAAHSSGSGTPRNRLIESPEGAPFSEVGVRTSGVRDLNMEVEPDTWSTMRGLHVAA